MQKLETLWIEDRLKKIAATLIESHRNGDGETIALYAGRIPEISRLPPKRQFMRLIQVFHPDRLAVFIRQIADCREAGDKDALANIEVLLDFTERTPNARSDRSSRSDRRERGAGEQRGAGEHDESWSEQETYEYGEDDFGFGYEVPKSDEYDDYEEDDLFAEGSFMEAIKREFFGNCDLYPTKFEVEQFTGELDLSDYGLDDLSGAESCVNVTSLNLAMNRIDNVWPLRDLVHLEFLDLSSNELESADELAGLASLVELDLSFNDIDDVAFLLSLSALKCVSLVGNPVRDRSVLEKLGKLGVTVVI